MEVLQTRKAEQQEEQTEPEEAAEVIMLASQLLRIVDRLRPVPK
jgi:hypothetical protein